MKEVNTLELERMIVDTIEKTVKQAIEKHLINTHSQKQWLTLKESCQYIGVSYNTLRKFLDRGLKVSVINGVNKIRKTDIDQFLIEHAF